MKKAFSLIEIMQTIVLLGIIAGLSVSFFKKMNPDYKLYEATNRQLDIAIREVDRRLCSDNTPVLVDANNNDLRERPYANPNNADKTTLCWVVYGNTASFNPDIGYCQADKTAAHACVSNVAAYNTYPTMRDNGDGTCIADLPPVPDSGGRNIFSPDVDAWLRTNSYTLPIKDVFCPNGVPDYARNIPDFDSTSVFCVYLAEVLAHKKQGTTDTQDIRLSCRGAEIEAPNPGVPFTANQGNSCTSGGAAHDCTPNETDPTNINIYVNAISAVTRNNANAVARGNYNMLLPNGARLYNLGKDGTFPINIYIKYDRIGDADTARYELSGGNVDLKNSTIAVKRISNPSDIVDANNQNSCQNAGGIWLNNSTCYSLREEINLNTRNICVAKGGNWTAGACNNVGGGLLPLQTQNVCEQQAKGIWVAGVGAAPGKCYAQGGYRSPEPAAHPAE